MLLLDCIGISRPRHTVSIRTAGRAKRAKLALKGDAFRIILSKPGARFVVCVDCIASTADVRGMNAQGYITTTANIARWAIRNQTVIVDPDELTQLHLTA
jgi:hypothetical protein